MANLLKFKERKAHVGDTVKVYYKLSGQPLEKEHVFEGILMAIKGTGDNKMFTVRKISKDKIGIERIFPVISPFITDLQVASKGKVRRSKLYFIRGLSGRHLRERLS